MLYLHGEEVIPLSKLVKEFCLKQGNMKETAVFQQLVYARWAWKELFRKYIWAIKNQVLEVDCKNNTIQLPVDCERLINIYVIDRDHKLQPLTCDPGINTVEIKCIKMNCSCNNCNGNDTLCAAAESGVTYTTENVIIQGAAYLLQTWVRYNGNGGIQKQQSIPTYNASSGTIVYNTEITTLCNIEVTEKGCIKPTPENMYLLNTYCGCNAYPPERSGYYNGWRGRNQLIPQPYNYYGYWNVNAADPSIIHIFRQDTGINPNNFNEPYRNTLCKVIVAYQTNGETPGDEIMVPQYAQLAMDSGIMWQQKFYNNRASIADKNFAKMEWQAARLDVNKHLNPIRIEDIEKLQTQPRRW